MPVAVGRYDDTLGVERLDVLDLVVLADLGSCRGRCRRESPDEARGLDGAVVRVGDRAVEEAGGGARDVLEPFRLEAVLAQRLVLEPDAVALFLVAREAIAAGAPQRVAGELGHPVERFCSPAPVAGSLLRAVRLAGDVVACGPAAEREAAVAPTRALGDAARVVHPDAQAGLGQPERGRAARDAGTDDRDVDAAVDPRVGPRRARFFQPVRIHEARRYTPSHTATRPSSSSSTRARAISFAAEARLAREFVGARRQELEQRRLLSFLGFGLDPERGEDVGGARQRRCAQLEQRVRPRRQRARDLTGNRENLSAFLEREVGRDQGAAALARLDDDGCRAESGHDSVARRKAPRSRLDSRRVLRNDQARGGDPACELSVCGGIVPVDAAAEHGDGRPVPSSAPRCASASIPRARPLTTTRPAPASSRPRLRATEAP